MNDAIKLSVVDKKYAEHEKETEFCEKELKTLTCFYDAENWRSL
jgi:hypothetical protein